MASRVRKIWRDDRGGGRHDACAEPRVLVIAEAGVNHNGDVNEALKLIDIAARAGADVVKFQTFKAELLASRAAPMADYQKGSVRGSNSQYEMLKQLELDPETHRRLQAHCRSRNVEFMSTPFDEGSVDLLVELGVPAIKVSSGDLTNRLLLEHIAAKAIPVILSTGMATNDEIECAVELLHAGGAADVALMHCVSDYPAEERDANLLAIPALKERFGVPVGWSDHTRGDLTAIVAVGLGATIVEKHITLDRLLPGPDHKASMDPVGFARYVQNIRMACASLGDGIKQPTPSERVMASIVRRSLAAARCISAGETLTRDMVIAIRPGTGMPPGAIDQVLGKRAILDIASNTLLEMDMLA